MKLASILFEREGGTSIQGQFKAVIIAGLPGSGKTTVIKQIQNAMSTKPVTLTVDEYLESARKQTPAVRAGARVHVTETLSDAVNRTLPIILETTGNEVNRTLTRAVTLHRMGYDVNMFWLDVDLATALSRVERRNAEIGREVDQEYINQVEADKQYNLARYQQHFGSNFHFIKSDNVKGAPSQITNSLTGPIQNPKGLQLSKIMKERNVHTLYPDVLTPADLKYVPSGWFKKY